MHERLPGFGSATHLPTRVGPHGFLWGAGWFVRLQGFRYETVTLKTGRTNAPDVATNQVKVRAMPPEGLLRVERVFALMLRDAALPLLFLTACSQSQPEAAPKVNTVSVLDVPPAEPRGNPADVIAEAEKRNEGGLNERLKIEREAKQKPDPPTR